MSTATETVTPAKQDLLGLSMPRLRALLERMDEKPFRARQIFEWIHKKNAEDFSAMTNLPDALRQALAQDFEIHALKIHRRQVSERDGTTKFLLECSDKELVEAVFLPHEGRNTACISTQVGCAMGCRFCATGDSGFARNLSPSEIVSQISAIERDRQQDVHNLVFMGMGEPLHNWDAVRESLLILLDPAGRQWGPRHITLSTCGVVSGIDQLTASGLKVRLAVSLHSASDEVRSQIMPINRRYPLKELMRSLRDYQKASGLQVTFEVALFAGVNDSDADAMSVVRLVRGMECKVNLIPYNPVAGLPFKVPDFKRVASFQDILRNAGIITMIRTEKGGDIDAACGQLRRRDTQEHAA